MYYIVSLTQYSNCRLVGVYTQRYAKLRSVFNLKDNAGTETDGPKLAMNKLTTDSFYLLHQRGSGATFQEEGEGKKSIQ